MKKLSRTRLFLLEMLVNLLIFSIGAAICIMTLSQAYSLSASGRVLTKAQRITENAAMTFRAVDGNIKAMPSILNGQLTDENKMEVWYDKNWNVVSPESGIYCLKLRVKPLENNVMQADIAVYPPDGDAVTRLSVCEYQSQNQEDL